MNNRYLLCLLVCIVLLYFSVPRIAPGLSGSEGLFALSWLGLALLVLAGNLSALLFTPQKQRKLRSKKSSTVTEIKRMRSR